MTPNWKDLYTLGMLSLVDAEYHRYHNPFPKAQLETAGEEHLRSLVTQVFESVIHLHHAMELAHDNIDKQKCRHQILKANNYMERLIADLAPPQKIRLHDFLTTQSANQKYMQIEALRQLVEQLPLQENSCREAGPKL